MTSQPPSPGITSDDRTAHVLALDLSAYKASGSRGKGPVEILCKEIDFRFERDMESRAIFLSFVAILVSEVAGIRGMQQRIASIAGVLENAPSPNSAEALRRVEELILLSDVARTAQTVIDGAAEVHDFIHEIAHEDDHLIDMLSSCVSAIRFGLETPCCSRHAASAANHIWKRKYGVRLFDSFTPAWEKDWARAMLQQAITRLALKPNE